MVDLWRTHKSIQLLRTEMEDSTNRVGSNRDDSPEKVGVGRLATMISSLLPIVGTLVLVSAYCTLCIGAYLVLRPRLQRVYSPQTQSALVSPGSITASTSSWRKGHCGSDLISPVPKALRFPIDF